MIYKISGLKFHRILIPLFAFIISLIYLCQLFIASELLHRNDNFDNSEYIITFLSDGLNPDMIDSVILNIPDDVKSYSKIYLSRFIKTSTGDYYSINTIYDDNTVPPGYIDVNSFFLDYAISYGMIYGSEESGYIADIIGKSFYINRIDDESIPMVSDNIYMNVYCSFDEFFGIINRCSSISIVYYSEMSALDRSVLISYFNSALPGNDYRDLSLGGVNHDAVDKIGKPAALTLMILALIVCSYEILEYSFLKFESVFKAYMICGCKYSNLVLFVCFTVIINSLIGIIAGSLLFECLVHILYSYGQSAKFGMSFLLINSLFLLIPVSAVFTPIFISRYIKTMYSGRI